MRTRLILLLLWLAAAGLGAGGAAAAQGLVTQSSSAAGVTVKATPRTLPGGVWEFEIVFDTHTQALNDDLVKTATLHVDGTPLAAAGWHGDPPGAHHRKGVLKFAAVDPRAHEIELRLARPGEPKPRSFRWRLAK